MSDFILVLHNMYERQRAVSVSYFVPKTKWVMIVSQNILPEMECAQLHTAINRTNAGLNVQDRLSKEFLKSIDAVCKSMGHTNEAAKSARLKMLADTVRFGTGAVFLTVTPDDGNCLRIKIYIEHKATILQIPCTASEEEVKADFELSLQLRQELPGIVCIRFSANNRTHD